MQRAYYYLHTEVLSCTECDPLWRPVLLHNPIKAPAALIYFNATAKDTHAEGVKEKFV